MDRYSFFAYAPYASATNGITIAGDAQSAGLPQLNYSVPLSTANQPDLMMAVPVKNIAPTSLPILLTMKHALACIGFQIAGFNQERITQITITGVATTGSASLDGSSIAWTLGSSQGAFSPIIQYDANQSYRTVGGTMSTNLLSNNGYLMMIPQTLSPSAQVTVTFGDGSTEKINLQRFTAQWQAGMRYTYQINTSASKTSFTAFTPTSNCYVVQPNPLTSVGFSYPAAKRVNEYWKSGASTYGYTNHANAIGSTDEWYAEVVWADFDYNERVAIIQRLGRKTGVGPSEKLSMILSPGSYQGNMVVALWKDANKNQSRDANEPYLWSWHLWISSLANGRGSIDQSGNSFSIQDGNVTEAFTILDRNLGARASLPTAADPTACFGTYYQWGRKDPFPPTQSVTGASESVIYTPRVDGTYGTRAGAFGTVGFGSKEQATSSTSLDLSLANPLTFYGSGTISLYQDWLQSGNGAAVNDRWVTSASRKTLFDPSPYGWCIPRLQQWITFVATDNISNFNNSGVFGNYYKGVAFFPATGYRFFTNSLTQWEGVSYQNEAGNLENVNIMGVYWSAYASVGTQGFVAYFMTNPVGAVNNPRALGNAIRPIRYTSETP
ncbi:MAG: fimbrillin family protein [Alistipes sp.]|nr:fimbrillin family protein [Alistipes sp.]